MEYSYKVIIFQASCRKVKGFPTKIVVNLIENVFKVKIFPATIAGNICSGIPPLDIIILYRRYNISLHGHNEYSLESID